VTVNGLFSGKICRFPVDVPVTILNRRWERNDM
jgi:hypothetical protein